MTTKPKTSEAASAASATIRVISTSRNIDEISRLLHAIPSRTSAESKSISSSVVDEVRWMLDSTSDETMPLEEHVKELLVVLRGREDAVKTLVDECQVDLWCTVTSSAQFTGLVFDRSTIEQVAALG